jgi:hypothetical protein
MKYYKIVCLIFCFLLAIGCKKKNNDSDIFHTSFQAIINNVSISFKTWVLIIGVVQHPRIPILMKQIPHFLVLNCLFVSIISQIQYIVTVSL